MWEKNILGGISGNAVRQREARALRKLRRIFNANENVLVQGEDIQEINSELEKISEEEKDIYNLEKLLMYFNENDGSSNATLDELGIQISDEMQKFLDSEDIGEEDFDYFKLKTEYYIQDRLRNYYENLSNTIQKKEMLEQKKERHKEFLSIYEPAEREYLNNEDIFDPDYTIKGIKITKLKESKDIPAKKSIYDLNLPTITLVYLHHSGISTIQDLLSKAENVEQLEEFLNSIKGLDEIDKNMITEYVIDNKYFNKAKLNNDEDANSKLLTDIAQLNLSISAYNCLKRAGIKSLGDLANRTEKDLREIRNLGEATLKEIATQMQEYGIYLKTEEEIKQSLIEVVTSKQKKIKSQEAEISDLKSKRRSLDEQE